MILVILSLRNVIRFRRLGIGILAYILDTSLGFRGVTCSRRLLGGHFCLCLQRGYVYFIMQFYRLVDNLFRFFMA